MEKRKIVINSKTAVYLKNASNAFVKYVNTLRDYMQHNNIKIRKECHNNIKIRKECYYEKMIFWENIDKMLNAVGVNKKYNNIDILIDIINFILEHNYVAHEYYDTYVALPSMDGYL